MNHSPSNSSFKFAPFGRGTPQKRGASYLERVRMHAGIFEAERVLKIAPWQQPVDPMEGVIVHSC